MLERQFVYGCYAQSRRQERINGDGLRYDNATVPAVVFLDPQVASVGMTEAQARAAAGSHLFFPSTMPPRWRHAIHAA